MSGPLRYGVVGCSSMGETHAKAVERVDGAELVACADIDEPTARELGDAHGCDAYADHAAMLDGADLDAVSVCTPNGTHADVVVDAAAADAAVLCEKPLDVTPERVDRLVDACREAGVTLGGVFQRRTLPEMEFFRETVRSDEFGRVLLADAELKWHRGPSYFEGWHGSASLDGGVLFTQALHVLDLLRWAVGDVTRVAASFDTLHHDVEVPDTAALSLEFEGGARGTVSATTATQPGQPIRLRANGTEGSVRLHEGGVDAYETAAGRQTVDLDPAEEGAHTVQVRDFVGAVREGREPMIPPADARAAVDVVFAAQASVRRGEWVPVDEFGDRA
ncbi:Gfo/Idh/MocA family protein [Candidatus Halobonum tyrrellensis]|uniref:Dehydrogenase n=1 Tax=Candidatus Halobonum tyrrellensis G22 TaxID=1324957 RepID=V4GYC5_9EURY|nr:Gfo/Idh/MocA family oxidoreductase [Candidatus Halobonum tyrrellensis]ESP90191.1 hypothetical protein K933_01482 [Candidatus Halobonum tyrrellensis G22]